MMTISGSPWIKKIQHISVAEAGAEVGVGVGVRVEVAAEQLAGPTPDSEPLPTPEAATLLGPWMGKTLSAPALEEGSEDEGAGAGAGEGHAECWPDSGLDTRADSASSSAGVESRPASPTSPASLTSPASPTSPASLTSPASPASPTSPTSPASPTSCGAGGLVSALRPPPPEPTDAPLEDDGHHPLLEERRVDYSPAVIQRAFLAWAQLGHSFHFKDVCNYFHVLHSLEETFSPKDRLWSRERDLELLQKSPPTSDYQEYVFPNLYPRKPPYITHNGQVKRAIRKSNSLSPNSALGLQSPAPCVSYQSLLVDAIYAQGHRSHSSSSEASQYNLWGSGEEHACGYQQRHHHHHQQQQQTFSQYSCAGAGVYLPPPPTPQPQPHFKYTTIQYTKVYPVQGEYLGNGSIWDYGGDRSSYSCASPSAGLKSALGMSTAGAGAGAGAGTPARHQPPPLLTYSSVVSGLHEDGLASPLAPAPTLLLLSNTANPHPGYASVSLADN